MPTASAPPATSTIFATSSAENLAKLSCLPCTTICRFTFSPLLIASDLASVSTMCDELVEGLNAKCVEDIASQKIVAPLIETRRTLNQGQGLGVSP